jgi:hypothetical protein
MSVFIDYLQLLAPLSYSFVFDCSLFILASCSSIRAISVLKRANAPSAGFPVPTRLLKSAPALVTVFSSAVFARSVAAPTPVQKLPSVKLRSEYIPFAVLYTPVVKAQKRGGPFCCVASGISPRQAVG